MNAATCLIALSFEGEIGQEKDESMSWRGTRQFHFVLRLIALETPRQFRISNFFFQLIHSFPSLSPTIFNRVIHNILDDMMSGYPLSCIFGLTSWLPTDIAP
jgi:2C-methyl-D-erythritol 2,4-cyclodiphosphate synthase